MPRAAVWVSSCWSWSSCSFQVDYRGPPWAAAGVMTGDTASLSSAAVRDRRGLHDTASLVLAPWPGLTGAAVALLLAPQSGQGTRSLINQRIRDGVDRGRKARERIARKGREVLEGASNYLGKQQKDLEQRHDRLVSVEAGRQPEDKPGL